MTASPARDPYEELADLAEAAVELAEQDRVEELAAIFERTAELTASLPAQAPSSARPALERAAAAQERLRARLGAALLSTRSELDHLARGRRAARAYGGLPGSELNLQA